MTRILAINGSYRKDGITDQAVAYAKQSLTTRGATVEVVNLREMPIGFCLNCRQCTQQPGEQPGQCVQNDDMQALVAKIEAADGFILASPTNFGTVTALFKRFMERLLVFAFWPWGKPAPVMRHKTGHSKKALTIASCAAPGIMGRWMFNTTRQLKQTAKIIGAKPVGNVFTGLVAARPHPGLPDATKQKLDGFVRQLL